MFRAAVADGDRLRQRTRIDGIGLSSALAVGGTPWPGIVLGGRIWTANVSPRFVEAGKLVIPDDDSVKLTLLRMGPFVDWYPFPHTGFHTLAEAGWTTQIERDTKGHPSKPVAMGAFVALFTGYEWFVSKQLSFGFLAGIAGGHVRRDRQEGYESSSFLAPELTLTATYH